MAVPKKLFIPRKTQDPVQQPDYGTDMRAIEIFNPINQLVAGSGVSLSPSNGQGPSVTISASGGGLPNAFMGVRTGPDSIFVTTTAYLGAGGPTGLAGNAIAFFPLWNSSITYNVSYGISWLVPVNEGVGAGGSVSILPIVNTAHLTFSSGSINFAIQYGATTVDGAQQRLYRAIVSVPSGAQYQIQTTDLTNDVTTGADLSLVAGSGISGNGLISAAGTFSYFCNLSIIFECFAPVFP